MGEVVNLNRFRKEKRRSEDRAEADANALRFCRTKAQKELDRARAEKGSRDHAAHLRNNDHEDDGA